MTTEIAVSNQLGIALATDSAVTITGGGHTKVFDTADKLFELSANYPVAVMINGNMDCLGTPWEILIKDFRNIEGGKPRGGIVKWARDFLSYIEQHNGGTEDSPGGFVDRAIIAEIDRVQQLILFVIREFVFSSWNEKSPILSRKNLDVSQVLAAAIKIRRDAIDKLPIAPSLKEVTRDSIVEKYQEKIRELLTREFKGQALSDPENQLLVDLIVDSLLRTVESGSSTGIVVAGYGADDTFPAVFSSVIDGRIGGKLKVLKEDFSCISDCRDGGMVTSFAQTDVIERLLKGADVRFVRRAAEFIEQTVFDAVTKTFQSVASKKPNKKLESQRAQQTKDMASAAKDEFLTTAAEKIKDNFSREFDAMIAMMPKQELIELAEALVSITAIERKATDDEGTVGGPVDVALITKHEGFVWIKRKHHFQRELNPRYFWRKYGAALQGSSGT
ncbi:MAG: hypothetical protein ABSC92_02485 [Rhizomicrobium sp.]|jgi:hypothetical protein